MDPQRTCDVNWTSTVECTCARAVTHHIYGNCKRITRYQNTDLDVAYIGSF